MPSNYPAVQDSFNEPSLPEETALAQAGTATRNHTEHHRDLGDAIEAVEANAAVKDHDHSGDASDVHKGGKLSQANTHENDDTDSADNAKHHTLGTGAHQAAKGSHTHNYGDLNNLPLIPCTSNARPPTPTLGLLIYELDTFRLRSWAQYPGDTAPFWHYLLGPLPTVRLRQGFAQKLVYTGTILEWHQEIEDGSGMFNQSASPTNIVVKETGQYQIDLAVQWDPSVVPDQAHVVILVNGLETDLRQSQFIRGNTFNPGFSQTISVSGKLRLQVNDIVTVKVSYAAPSSILDLIFSFFDGASEVNSRIDMTFQGS